MSKHFRIFTLSMVIAMVLISACKSGIQASGGELSADTRSTQLAELDYPGFKTDGLDPYSATFEIRFEGSYTWTYVLRTRFDGEHTEYHMEYLGLDASEDPGPVRMVSDGNTSRMLGAATDNLCFLFPSDLDSELTFFTPDNILDPFLANEDLEKVKSERIEGINTDYLSAQYSFLGDWENVQVDIWVSKSDGATMLYEMGANGSDPFFQAGEGHITMNYLVKEFAEQSIEPVAPCPIPVPLPDDITNLSSFPGRVSFESDSSLSDMVVFYQYNLPLDGWKQSGTVEYGDDAAIMTFERGDEIRHFNIEETATGVNVEILIQ